MTAAPDLVIFDIDATLLVPNAYHHRDEVQRGLYDDKLLTPFLGNPKYQVALASFNHDVYQNATPYGGRRLGRLILDLQHPEGDSSKHVEDEFIQAWMFSTMQQMYQHGKNEHIQIILHAYRKKYGKSPRTVMLFDDRIENCYLAGKNGIRAHWVTSGLTRDNIHGFAQIGNRVQFSTEEGQIRQCISRGLEAFAQYIQKHPHLPNTTPLYSLYLPPNRDTAQLLYTEFVDRLFRCGIVIHVILSDLNHIV